MRLCVKIPKNILFQNKHNKKKKDKMWFPSFLYPVCKGERKRLVKNILVKSFLQYKNQIYLIFTIFPSNLGWQQNGGPHELNHCISSFFLFSCFNQAMEINSFKRIRCPTLMIIFCPIISQLGLVGLSCQPLKSNT